MNDLRHELEQARLAAPVEGFGLETFYRRRELKESRRRFVALGASLVIGLSVVVGTFAALRATPDPKWQPAGGDAVIPIAGPGEYYVWSAARFDVPPGAWNEREVRWNTEGGGRLTYIAHGHSNQPAPPRALGDYEAAPIPSDAAGALQVLLERSADGGASPGPHTTPAADIPLSEREYDVFRAVNDLSGIDSDAFLATPAQVSVMMRVLEGMPGATMTSASDPVGRPALRIEFREGDEIRYIFVDPTTHILLATGGHDPDLGGFTDMVVLTSGIASALDGRITEELIPAASPSDLTFFSQLR
jgi:hypothetical protein